MTSGGAVAGPLRILEDIHAGDLGTAPEDWLVRLGGPSWFVVPGRDRRRTRVVTTLLHGSEPSGVRALHAWLRTRPTPAVDVACYVGSVAAALALPRFSHRMLPGHRDANRCFLPPFDDQDGELAREVLAQVRAVAPEALVDLHDNTGHSPAYGVGVTATAPQMRLTSLFAERYMLNDLRLGTLMEATQGLCPSVVIECGMAGSEAAFATALGGLRRLTEVADLELTRAPARPLRILHSPVRVSLLGECGLSFGERAMPATDLTLRAGFERLNFTELPAGTELGWLLPGSPWPLSAHGAAGQEVSRDLFANAGGRLVTLIPMIPIMMTARVDIAKQDCLFYAMQASDP